MPGMVRPYEIVRRLLLAGIALPGQVGVNIWVGGIPPKQRDTTAIKAVNIFTTAGDENRYIHVDHFEFQIECFGPTREAAWDVYTALREDFERTKNRMQAITPGSAYTYQFYQIVTGFDADEPLTEWPMVVSTWRLTNWRKVKGSAP